MSRRKAAPKRKILPDPLFGSEQLAKFINVIMVQGKRSVAEKIAYQALDQVVKKQRARNSDENTQQETSDQGTSIFDSPGLRKYAIEIFDKVLTAVRPTVEVRSRRVGGATYQIPMEVKRDRGIALAMRWLVDSAKKRSEKSMALRLANEMLDALQGRGGSMKQRETVHNMAKANAPFAHFRW